MDSDAGRVADAAEQDLKGYVCKRRAQRVALQYTTTNVQRKSAGFRFDRRTLVGVDVLENVNEAVADVDPLETRSQEFVRN